MPGRDGERWEHPQLVRSASVAGHSAPPCAIGMTRSPCWRESSPAVARSAAVEGSTHLISLTSFPAPGEWNRCRQVRPW